LALILTGAGRYDEAAEAFKDLLQFQMPDLIGSSVLSKKDLLYCIGESYYNAGKLGEAEKYFESLNSLDPDNINSSIMRKKISL